MYWIYGLTTFDADDFALLGAMGAFDMISDKVLYNFILSIVDMFGFKYSYC